MSETKIEALDLPAWVEKAEPHRKHFREAVHIILTAISSSTALKSTMIMKGGMLMAIRYNSERFTKDADFSTEEKYIKGDAQALVSELIDRINAVNEIFTYDTMCRYQRCELRPAREGATFPTLSVNIGYAPRSKERLLERLLNGQAPTIVEIDYSYNEAVLDVEILRIDNGEEIKAYSFLNLLAEKFRSLIQQPSRKRYRRQDVYDIHLLLSQNPALSHIEQYQLVSLLNNSCQSRGIAVNQNSLDNNDIKSMSEQGYSDLASEIDGPFPDFNTAFTTLQEFYESLPWDDE